MAGRARLRFRVPGPHSRARPARRRLLQQRLVGGRGRLMQLSLGTLPWSSSPPSPSQQKSTPLLTRTLSPHAVASAGHRGTLGSPLGVG